MSDRLRTHTTDELTVTFDPTRRTHPGTCIRGLPDVFDVRRKPWVLLTGASADAIEAQVRRCPSGALQVKR